MNELVFLDPNDINETPFTTSEVIAENGKVRHDTVQHLIRDYQNDIEEFGKLAFEMRPYGEGINGFKIRKSNAGRPEKIYHLNEEQATLLITYMKNTLPVRNFKKALVKQFYIMQKELTKRITTREIGKRAREALTDAIQGLPESPHKCFKYNQYTDLIYKIVFGKIARKLREEYGITKKDSLRDRFSAEENEKVDKLEQMISSMIELGYDYGTIKAALTKKYLKTA
ncbi:MAG: Rha family transcriptional regulator [Candidatus Paceibacterota bacterium]